MPDLASKETGYPLTFEFQIKSRFFSKSGFHGMPSHKKYFIYTCTKPVNSLSKLQIKLGILFHLAALVQ